VPDKKSARSVPIAGLTRSGKVKVAHESSRKVEDDNDHD
jgi:hypothetical protein